MEYPFSGEVFIHAVARTALRQVEWMLSDILDYQVPLMWANQPAKADSVRTGFAWQGEEDSGATLTSALAGWRDIFFEVIQEPFGQNGGSRWMYVPELGIKHRSIDEFGNFVIGETELRAALDRSNNSVSLNWEIKNLLADAWEQELEPLRSLLIASNQMKIKRVG